MKNIYTLPLNILLLIILITSLIWAVLVCVLNRKIIMYSAIGLLFISLLAVLHYTVFYRVMSHKHVFSFFAPHSSEFYREMFMNVFLYFPFGLSLSALIGPWAILVAFIMSLFIEIWQFSAGTGFAQGTDVICNTLGCAVGILPYVVSQCWLKNNDN